MPAVKLTQEIADEIRQRYSAGSVSQPQLAREYGLSQSSVGRIVTSQAWIGGVPAWTRGKKRGPQSPEHVAKRFANGAGAQKGKAQSPEAVRAAAEARRGRKRAYSPVKAEITRQKWADGVYDALFKRQAKFVYNGIGMRSNWERLAAAQFDERGIQWEYEPKRFRLPTGHHYHPDFYLPDLGLWIEVKGYATLNALAKFDMFVGLGHNAVLVTGQNDAEFLKELEDVIAVMTGDVTVSEATT